MDDDLGFDPVRSSLFDVDGPPKKRRRLPYPGRRAPVPVKQETMRLDLGGRAGRRRAGLAWTIVAVAVVGAIVLLIPMMTGDDPGSAAGAVPLAGESLDAAPVSDPSIDPVPSEEPSAEPSASPSPGSSPAAASSPPVKPVPSKVGVGAPSPAAPTTYSGIAGPGCPARAASGYAFHGWYTNGRLGWVTDSAGSWTGDGCAGSWASMPMSGKDTADAGISTTWWFATGLAKGTCTVQVYVPKGTRSWDSWGDPAYYEVLASRSDATVTARFTIGQKWGSNWIAAGTFAFTKGELSIRLTDRGTNNADGQKLALGPIRVSCKA